MISEFDTVVEGTSGAQPELGTGPPMVEQSGLMLGSARPVVGDKRPVRPWEGYRIVGTPAAGLLGVPGRVVLGGH